jgi:hypothetical protein
MDPFTSGPHTFDTTAPSLSAKNSIKTRTSSISPSTSTQNLPILALEDTGSITKSIDLTKPNDEIVEDGRGSPDPMQSYYNPVNRGQSKRVSRIGDDDRHVGGEERKLFVVNASPDESEEEM